MPDRYERMLFNYETSNRTEYRDGEIRPIVKTVYQQKPSCYRIRPPALKDIHTLSEWKTPNVPFDLLLKPKDVVRTNPWKVQQRYEKSPDLGWEHAKNTRPRLVMTPAVSMDDIDVPESRKLLIQDIYSSTAQRAMRDGIQDSFSTNIRAPFPGRPAPANPIKLEKLRAPYVSPEWRMDSVSWDGRQLRSYCDPRREFYLARTTKCSACDVTATLEARKKLAKRIKTH
ncbi:unnamed protein product, partial [Brenthis ino]